MDKYFKAIPKDLDLIIPYSSGDGSVVFDVVTDSDGTINSSDVTGLTSVVYKVNSTVVSLPFSINVGDTVTIEFDTVASSGIIKLIGIYA